MTAPNSCLIEFVKTNYAIVRRPGGLRAMTVTLTRRKVKRVKRLEVEASDRGVIPGDSLCRSDQKIGKVAEAWEALEHATLSGSTWWKLLHVLIGSTAAPVQCVTPAPRMHPLEEVDLRRWLCDPRALEEICEQFREVGRQAMLASKYESCRVAARELFLEGRVCDPFLYVNHRAKASFGALTLNGLQCERVLPWLRTLACRDLSRVIGKWELLHAESPEAAWVILSQAKSGSVEGWLDLFLDHVPAAQRCELLRYWLHHKGAETEFSEGWQELVPEALHVPHRGRYEGLRFLCESQLGGHCVARARAALSLWTIYDWRHVPSASGERGDCSVLVEKVCSLYPEQTRRSASSFFFELLGSVPGSRSFLEHLAGTPCSDDLLERLYRWLENAHCSRKDAGLLWAKLTRDFELLCSFLEQIPEDYLGKALRLFETLFWQSCQVDPDLEDYLLLIAKQCRKPLSFEEAGGEVLSTVLVLDSKETVRALAWLPEHTWRRFDDACRSWRRAGKIKAGVRRLTRETTWLFLAGLEHRVRRTMKVFEVLGSHPKRATREIVEGLSHHPLQGIVLTLENYPAHLALLTHALGRAASDRLAKLREIHDGRRQFRRDVVAKFLAELQGQVVEVLLNWLEEECDEDLKRQGRGFGGVLDPHTLLLLADIGSNRRVFRRMLRGYTASGEGAIWNHRMNHDWLAKHREIVSRGWLQRNEISVEAGSCGVLTMFIEQRFEEVLKMGTSVNSCLAIGGCNSHSAVANAVDANKQVVMAYNAGGEFVGRQLIAISEEKHLVCFDVYARKGAPTELERAFAAVDFHLAELLGLAVERDDEGYTVSSLVCRDWYDDYAWNPLEIGAPARILRVEPASSSLQLSF